MTGFFDRRRGRIALGATIVMMLIGGFGSLWLVGGPHEVTVAEAVNRFRSRPTPAPPSSAPTVGPTSTASAPAPARNRTATGTTSRPSASSRPNPTVTDIQEGVYTYATEGYESTDALSGARHDYPSQTALTYSRGECGIIERWQPLNERWDESVVCDVPGGNALRHFSMYHEFFHQGLREDFACPASAIVNPRHPVAGQQWSFHCASDKSTIDLDNTVVGYETLTIGGRSVRAIRIRYDARATGADQGNYVQERWMNPDTGLLLKKRTHADMTIETSVGRAHYYEEYELNLTSLTPSR